ncbi:hypothetical protein D3C79_695660 [compost metagenome]
MIEQFGQHLAQAVAGTRIGGLAADQKHIQPVPQHVVIQVQGCHVQLPRPIEPQIVEEALGLQHGLADIPVGVAIEDIDQLFVPALQVETPDGGEQEGDRDGGEQQIVALASSHLMTSMRTSCHTMPLWMADKSSSGYAEKGISSQSGPLLRRVSGLSS